MRTISEYTGLAIPEGARGLNFAYKPTIDPAFLARIEIPGRSRDFVEKQVVALNENRIDSSGGLTEKIRWWKPTQGQVIIDRMFFDTNNGRTIHAILATEADSVSLYVDYSS